MLTEINNKYNWRVSSKKGINKGSQLFLIRRIPVGISNRMIEEFCCHLLHWQNPDHEGETYQIWNSVHERVHILTISLLYFNFPGQNWFY